MRRWLPALERPRSITILRWAIALVLVAGLLAFVVKGADNPEDPSLAPPGALSVPGSLSHPLAMM